jgi:hypothetical protein
MNRTWFLLSLIGLAAAIPNVTLAVDGVVLISQSSALAGNVTPGDAPGFPVTISVSGSYRLSSNLTVPDSNTNAIDITADNVTIDLNGFSIIGPVVCSGPGGESPVTSCSPNGTGIGVNNVFGAARNITVRNGDIHGMGQSGMSLYVGSLVEKVNVSNNGTIGIIVGQASKVSSCVVTRNGSTGIDALDGGVISGNTLYENGHGGIQAVCPSLIEGNTALFNGAFNVGFGSGSGCVVVNNAAP